MALAQQIGEFSWFSLMTNKPKEAGDFYINLLSWTESEYEIEQVGKSTIYSAADLSFGGPILLENNSIPSHWISYISVADVDASCKQVVDLGGKVVVPAFDIPTIGRTAVVNDPVGAAFHLFTPEDKSADMKVTGNKPGQICWIELMIDEPEKVLPFYKSLLGWKIPDPVPMAGGEYYSFEINGAAGGGIMKRPPEIPAMPPMWLPYMAVATIDPVVARVPELGGTVLMPKTEVPDTGFFSLHQDPSGALSYLFELDEKILQSK